MQQCAAPRQVGTTNANARQSAKRTHRPRPRARVRGAHEKDEDEDEEETKNEKEGEEEEEDEEEENETRSTGTGSADVGDELRLMELRLMVPRAGRARQAVPGVLVSGAHVEHRAAQRAHRLLLVHCARSRALQ